MTEMIVEANENHINDLTQLALLLWNDNNLEELKDEMLQLLGSVNDKVYLFLSEHNHYVGFIHISLRTDYVEASNSSPVAYVEGIYVLPEYRRQGISKKLMFAGENWGKSSGCTQIASDIEQGNESSYDFHLSVGFKESNRIITFIKDIQQNEV